MSQPLPQLSCMISGKMLEALGIDAGAPTEMGFRVRGRRFEADPHGGWVWDALSFRAQDSGLVIL